MRVQACLATRKLVIVAAAVGRVVNSLHIVLPAHPIPLKERKEYALRKRAATRLSAYPLGDPTHRTTNDEQSKVT